MANGGSGPFGDDYTDRRGWEQLAADRRSACRQIASMHHLPSQDAFRRQLSDAIARRRVGTELVQFEVVADEIGRESFTVQGELLVPAAAMADERVGPAIRDFGFAAEPVECLEDRVVRLRLPGAEGAKLRNIARIIRGWGYQASITHVAPLGPVVKGEGGPERSESGQPFPPEWSAPFRTQAAGEPARVAVIDTGITAEIRSDGWLVGVPRAGAPPDLSNIDLLNVLPDPADPFLDFAAGHGTSVAGVVAQVAPTADLRVYRAVDTDGVGDEVSVACTMLRAVDDGAQILNLSLGAECLDDQPLLAVQVALEMIHERDPEVLVIAAAGNYGTTRACWPAAFRSVVAVAGLTAQGRPTTWSTHGWWVDCSAVGEGVLSPYVIGQESVELDTDPDTFGPDSWAVWTGTSFAAPQVAGAVARFCEADGSTPRAALAKLLGPAPHVPEYGRALAILPGT